jgi:hypothetical protein
MVKSSPEKLAKALRANLKRRKGPTGRSDPKDRSASQRVPESSPAQRPAQPPEKP